MGYCKWKFRTRYINQYNRVCGKKMSKYIFDWVKKKTCLGVFRYRGDT